MKTLREKLTEARELISDPENWTQGCFARDKDGEEVAAFLTNATCWCAWGALKYVYDAVPTMGYVGINHPALLALKETIAGGVGLGDFNDRSDHHEVLAMFDKAISNCKEEE